MQTTTVFLVTGVSRYKSSYGKSFKQIISYKIVREIYILTKRWFHLDVKSIKVASSLHSVIPHSSFLYIINSNVENFNKKLSLD